MKNKNEMTGDADIAQVLGLTPETGRRSKLPVGAALCILALLIGIWLFSRWQGAAESKNVTQFKTQPLKLGDLVVTVTATGNLQPTNQVDVGSELSGIIKNVAVDFNDHVKVDQVLARLDPSKLTARVLQSRATLAAAKAKVVQAQVSIKEARNDLARLLNVRKLTNNKAVSDQDLETAKAALERNQADETAANATVDQMRAVLEANEADLEKAVIKSPINGMVLTRSVEPGQTVAASMQAPVLFTLAEDLSQMELQVDVDEADVGQVKEGQAAEFTVDAYPGRTFNAHITQVRYGAQTVNGVVTYKTILTVDNPDLALRPGMTATAAITVKTIKNTLLAPNAALRFTPPSKSPAGETRNLFTMLLRRGPRRAARSDDKAKAGHAKQRVWVLENGRPKPVTVAAGPSDGTFTAITCATLAPGAAVVVDTVRVTP